MSLSRTKKKKKPNLAVVQIDVHSPFVFNMSEVWSTDENVCKPVTKIGQILLLCDKNKKCVKCLAYDHASRWRPSLLQLLFDYADVTWRENSEGCCKELQCQQNHAAQKTLSVCITWLNLASRKKMHKCIVVVKCLNNLVPKYLVQYFTRNGELHNHATRRKNNLHPPKLQCTMGKRTFKYVGAIYFNSLPNCVESATSLNSFKNMIRYSIF